MSSSDAATPGVDMDEEMLIAAVARVKLGTVEPMTAKEVHSVLLRDGHDCTLAAVKTACSKAQKRAPGSTSNQSAGTTAAAGNESIRRNESDKAAVGPRVFSEMMSAERRLAQMTGDQLPAEPSEMGERAIARALDGFDVATAKLERIDADIAALRMWKCFQSEMSASRIDQARARQQLDVLETFRETFIEMQKEVERNEGTTMDDFFIPRPMLLERAMEDPTYYEFLVCPHQWKDVFRSESRGLQWRTQVAKLWGDAHGCYDKCLDSSEFDFARNCAGCGAVPADDSFWPKCDACELVRYCSADCQRLSWKRGHKKTCGKFTLTTHDYNLVHHDVLIRVVREYTYCPALTAILLIEVRFRTSCEQYYEALIDAGAVAATVQAMELYPDDFVVQENGCAIFQNVCSERNQPVGPIQESAACHSGRRAAIKAGAMTAACRAFFAHTQRAHVQENALNALSNCCMGDESSIPEICEQVRTLRLATLAVDSLPTHFQSATGLLSNVCSLAGESKEVQHELFNQFEAANTFHALIAACRQQDLSQDDMAWNHVGGSLSNLMQLYEAEEALRRVPQQMISDWLSSLPKEHLTISRLRGLGCL